MSIHTSSTFSTSKVALRLGVCAAALAGTLAMTTAAHADIITFSAPVSVTNSFDGIYLNLLTGASSATGAGTPGWDFNPYNSGTSLSFFWSATPSQASGVAATGTGPYLDLAAGSTISAASTFAQVTATANTLAFQSAGTHTLGFRFYNESTSAINYGYMTMLTGAGGTGFPLTITGWSFDNTGAGITVSAVPEASTTAMLSLGALALGALQLRRKRKLAA